MVIVFGSINLDITVPVARAPSAGETVLGGAAVQGGGGKGANQAHAARRAGADVHLFGAVGADPLAAAALAQLERSGVALHVRPVPGQATGMALITLEESGENRIVVAPGANFAARATDVDNALLGPDTIVLLQLEVPLHETHELAARAWRAGCRVMLNASPLRPDALPDLAFLDTVIVNALELAQLTGESGAPLQVALELARVRNIDVLLTQGAAGAVLARPDSSHVAVPGYPVTAVDTTGAGDTFAGVYAAACAAGASAEVALRRANAAAALCCTGLGVQGAQPDSAAIDIFLENHA
ncbi:ribokinase [Pseudoduganella flava]|nr:PfkB family carbohydrate kinase [Pseudoduganella flava]TWI42515.1 ribokinase [Pseudoduganella flava]